MQNAIAILQSDKSWQERRRAARLLRHDLTQDAVNALKDAVTDLDDEVAQVAATSLIYANKPEVTELVTKPRFALSKNSTLRWTAVFALSKFGDKSHFEFLLKMSTDPDWVVRDEVFSAFDHILTSLMTELESPNRESVDENIHLLIRMLQIRQKGVRQKIYSILLRAFQNLPHDMLIETLGSDNILVETGVINILGLLGRKSTIPHLASQASSKSLFVRLEVIKNVSMLGGPQAITVLIERLGDGDERVTNAAKDALLHLKNDPNFIDILIDRLDNVQNVTIRKNILTVMGRIKDPRVIPSLFANIGAPFYFVRQAATEALVQCKELIYDRVIDIMNPVPVSIAPFLKICKDTTRIQSRLQGIELIGKSKDPHAISILQELLSDPSSEIVSAAEEAMESLFKSNWERANCAHILGEIGNEDAIPSLLTALGDWSIEVRSEAIESLRKLRTVNSPDVFIAAFKNERDAQIRSEIIAGLGDIGQVSVQTMPTLVTALSDKSQIVRQQAARMLRIIGHEKGVLELLINHLADDSIEVRNASLNSLFALGESIVPHIIDTFTKSTNTYIIFYCMSLLGLHKNTTCETQIVKLAEESTNPLIAQRAKVVLRTFKSNRDADREILFTENQ